MKTQKKVDEFVQSPNLLLVSILNVITHTLKQASTFPLSVAKFVVKV